MLVFSNDCDMERWESATDEFGRTYYFDSDTLQTTWEVPRCNDENDEKKNDKNEEIEEHVRILLATKLQTCLRIGNVFSLQKMFRVWKEVPMKTPSRKFVPPLARAISSWIVQRNRTISAIARSLFLQDRVEMLHLRIKVLESAEIAEAEFDRLKKCQRGQSTMQ